VAVITGVGDKVFCAGADLKAAMQIEAECFNRLIGSLDMREGLRRFVERDHPDRQPGITPITPGLVKS
jgi:enoyl-CoA hydratase